MAPEHSKKRKRAGADEEAGKTSVKLSAQPEAQVGPALGAMLNRAKTIQRLNQRLLLCMCYGTISSQLLGVPAG